MEHVISKGSEQQSTAISKSPRCAQPSVRALAALFEPAIPSLQPAASNSTLVDDQTRARAANGDEEDDSSSSDEYYTSLEVSQVFERATGTGGFKTRVMQGCQRFFQICNLGKLYLRNYGLRDFRGVFPRESPSSRSLKSVRIAVDDEDTDTDDMSLCQTDTNRSFFKRLLGSTNNNNAVLEASPNNSLWTTETSLCSDFLESRRECIKCRDRRLSMPSDQIGSNECETSQSSPPRPSQDLNNSQSRRYSSRRHRRRTTSSSSDASDSFHFCCLPRRRKKKSWRVKTVRSRPQSLRRTAQPAAVSHNGSALSHQRSDASSVQWRKDFDDFEEFRRSRSLCQLQQPTCEFKNTYCLDTRPSRPVSSRTLPPSVCDPYDEGFDDKFQPKCGKCSVNFQAQNSQPVTTNQKPSSGFSHQNNNPIRSCVSQCDKCGSLRRYTTPPPQASSSTCMQSTQTTNFTTPICSHLQECSVCHGTIHQQMANHSAFMYHAVRGDARKTALTCSSNVAADSPARSGSDDEWVTAFTQQHQNRLSPDKKVRFAGQAC